MFFNYLLTAYRNIIRDSLFSGINILGLSLGFAASLLIFLFVWSELNYDTWVPKAEKLYRMESTYILSGRGPLPTTTVPAKVAPGIAKDYPSYIEQSTRIARQQIGVKREEKLFNETVNFVDSNFFELFPLTFSQGNRLSIFNDPSAVALSQEMAEKYFGSENPLGQVMSIQISGQTKDLRVAGVFNDLPENSHMDLDVITLLDEEALEAGFPGIMTNWFFPSTFTYFKLREGASLKDLISLLPEFSDRNNIIPPVPSYANIKPREYFQLVPINITDIHLDPRVPFDMKPHGSIYTLYAFSGIAVMLLFIASVNFVNLATARSLKRSKEVALRKTLGARRSQLVTQFMLEAFLTIALAALVALFLVEMSLPLYNDMLNLDLSLKTVLTPMGVVGMAGFVIAMTILSGAYPAFYVSKARPGDVLHSNKSSAHGSVLLRTILVTFQFSISIALISSTVILYQQTRYVLGLNLGYDTENIGVMNLPASPQAFELAKNLQNDIERIDGVEKVGISGGVPVNPAFASFAVFSDAIDSSESTSMQFVASGFGFMETFGIKPLEGRLFSKDFGLDELPIKPGQQGQFKGTVILNKRAVGKVGYTTAKEAVGQVLRISQPDGVQTEMTIVGVIPDVHFGDARLETQPMIFYNLPTFIGTISFKFKGSKMDQVRTDVEQLWRERMPDTPPALQFVEDIQGAQYDADRRQGALLTAFSILTILVAGFGLYGLAAFMAARRTKEVGIRKVLGASVLDIIGLFVWSMSKPILLANIIAWPLAWYFMNQWLTTFTYRIEMTVLPFMLAGVLVSLFGVLTVAGRTLSVARTHPSHALRTE
ncbi:ABC transporter permease [Temperatibacter marinus]|uniref:ABC transporter permease n=1 Tax=Temperatibacter marinus TaxID=1456591 RepID=A0AA52EB96_9PROT|nr:ABC transporter permease [Temperatibacter marinus]WND01560.1 ABC transporter permease [Temperatibacter marinus]